MEKPSFRAAEAVLYDFYKLQVVLDDLRAEAASTDRSWFPVARSETGSRPVSEVEREGGRAMDSKEIRKVERQVRAVQEMLASLDDRRRELVRLKYWSGRLLSMAEIAGRLGTSRSTAQRWRREAVEGVRERLAEE